MRPRLRSAYLCIKRNMKRLWVFYDYKDRVIPNTNNGLEAVFSDIKSKVRVHSGLTRKHRMKLIANTYHVIIDINIMKFVDYTSYFNIPEGKERQCMTDKLRFLEEKPYFRQTNHTV